MAKVQSLGLFSQNPEFCFLILEVWFASSVVFHNFNVQSVIKSKHDLQAKDSVGLGGGHYGTHRQLSHHAQRDFA